METSDLDAGEETGDDEGGADEVAGVVGAEVGAAGAGDEDWWCDTVMWMSTVALISFLRIRPPLNHLLSSPAGSFFNSMFSIYTHHLASP